MQIDDALKTYQSGRGYRAFHYGMLIVSVAALVVVATYIGLGIAWRTRPDSRIGVVRLANDRSPVPGAASLVTRTASTAQYTFDTSGLPVKHMVTLRAEVFNQPTHCTHGSGDAHCGEADLQTSGVGGSVVFLDSQLVQAAGLAHFAGEIDVNDSSQASQGTGLTNAKGAEIHLVLLDHGEASAEFYTQQFSTATGGCRGADQTGGIAGQLACTDLQYAVHRH